LVTKIGSRLTPFPLNALFELVFFVNINMVGIRITEKAKTSGRPTNGVLGVSYLRGLTTCFAHFIKGLAYFLHIQGYFHECQIFLIDFRVNLRL